jgi:4-hydroxybenzoate polyprenyltransferase
MESMDALSKLGEYMKLVRIEHAFMLAFAVLIAEIITAGAFPGVTVPLLASLLVPIFIEMGAFAENDYIDIKADIANRQKDRPLVKGTIRPHNALTLAYACYMLGVLLALFINPACFAIALIFALLSVAYNRKLKDLPLLGNAYIASTMAIPLLFGNFVMSGSLSAIVLSIAFLAFLAGLGREIVKTIQDMEGDRLARRSHTLPLLIGKKYAALLAAFVFADFVFFSVVPFYFGLKATLVPVGLVLAADLSFLYMALRLQSNQSPHFLEQARKLSLVAMAVGLAGVFLAAIA